MTTTHWITTATGRDFPLSGLPTVMPDAAPRMRGGWGEARAKGGVAGCLGAWAGQGRPPGPRSRQYGGMD